MDVDNCGNCVFFRAIGISDGPECRRNPPQVLALQTSGKVMFQPYWPPTRAANWCGEHKPETRES